ncbi:MAG: hypothetical protein LUI87_03265 [Lachnospiraceae bacterium]|nr:hypothetical protein [Lachnospiraceae bacterium]
MIDNNFWKRVADKWALDDDDIEIPDIGDPIIIDDSDDDMIPFDEGITDDEINDILDELGLSDF